MKFFSVENIIFKTKLSEEQVIERLADVNNEPERVFGLDLFRTVAILLVVLGHGMVLLDNTRFNGFPYFRMIDGVDLFFVLSGFLIGNILLKEINVQEEFNAKKTELLSRL